MNSDSSNPSADAVHVHEILEKLCQIYGPTGIEWPVREHLEATWRAHGVDASVDRVGNLLGRVGGRGPRVLLQAHMDEIGYAVRHVTEDGFLFLDSAQGGFRDKPERRFMVGQRAVVIGREGAVAGGALVAPSGHVLTPGQQAKPVGLSDFFLDVGVESRVQAEEVGIHIGAAVVWDSPTRLWGNRITSRAIDDRVGLAAIELALEQLDRDALSCELWVGATVQEENGTHGARAMGSQERFDAVLALDITLAGDTPVLGPTEVDNKLGKGPVVVQYDGVAAYDRKLSWALIDCARAAAIPVQHGVYNNYGTDGVSFLDTGSPAVALGPPARYTHTANEMVDVRDVGQTAALLCAYATSALAAGRD